jgi:hypothetical protein
MVQGQSINVNRSRAHAHESLAIVILLQGLQHDRRSALHEWLESRGYRDRMSLWVVHCKAGEMLAIRELLDCFLQGALCIAIKIALNIAG